MVALPGDAVLHDGMAVKIVNTDASYVRGHRDGRVNRERRCWPRGCFWR